MPFKRKATNDLGYDPDITLVTDSEDEDDFQIIDEDEDELPSALQLLKKSSSSKVEKTNTSRKTMTKSSTSSSTTKNAAHKKQPRAAKKPARANGDDDKEEDELDDDEPSRTARKGKKSSKEAASGSKSSKSATETKVVEEDLAAALRDVGPALSHNVSTAFNWSEATTSNRIVVLLSMGIQLLAMNVPARFQTQASEFSNVAQRYQEEASIPAEESGPLQYISELWADMQADPETAPFHQAATPDVN